MQGGGGNGPLLDLPRAATRADGAPMRSLVLHGVRRGAAVEGRVGDVPSVPRAAAAGSGEAVRVGGAGADEDHGGGGHERDVASAVGVAAGGDGRRDRDAAGGDGSGR